MNKIISGLAARWLSRRALAAAAAIVIGGWFAAGSVVPAAVAAPVAPAAGAVAPSTTGGPFGPNVYVFTPSMSQATIQSTLDSIASQQVSNQFGAQRYAIFFEPGTYGSTADPLIFQVGYYTTVAGLGLNPGDVVINGSIDVYNQCFAATPPATTPNCIALDNFWRSLSNLTVNVAGGTGCQAATDFWAVSQAAPMRRVHINGLLSLMDYCNGSPDYASGGFIADSEFTGKSITNGSQQQWVTRNSDIDGWSNGVWNQVFCGDPGAPAQNFNNGGVYTTLATCPVTEEEPFLYTDSQGNYNVFVPAVQDNSSGPAWASGTEAGHLRPAVEVLRGQPRHVGRWPSTSRLALGKDLILTPGVYDLDQPILVSRPDTVVLGLGMATLVPQRGNAAMVVASNNGVKLSGMIIDAGPVNSPVLLSVGTPGPGSASDPDLIQDIFFRIGGAETTSVSATVSLLDNASNSIIDNLWAWRADHGNAVGWTVNKADTGVVVTGNNVTAYGLAVEHYQKNEVIWSGQGGTDIFFQNEMPYDPPSQSAWMASPTQDGYPAFLVTGNVKSFQGYGMGSYIVFIQTSATLYADEAFQAPKTPGVQFHGLLVVYLGGSGGDKSIINGVGGPVTSTNNPGIGTPVNLTSYP